MRFYYKLAQHFLTLHFRGVVRESEKKDNEYFGWGKFFRSGVASTLSEDKQQQGDEIILAIDRLKFDVLQDRYSENDCSDSFDDFTRAQLHKIVDDYDSKISQMITKSKADNKGGSVNAVRNATEVLRKVQELCEEFSLWNVDYDENDPVAIFQYQMMLYMCSKINNTDTFSDKKQGITRSMLNRISEYKEQGGYTFDSCKRHIKDEIAALQTSNELLCVNNPKGLGVHVPISILSVNLDKIVTPSLGTLGDLLTHASTLVDSIRPEAQSEVRVRSGSMTSNSNIMFPTLPQLQLQGQNSSNTLSHVMPR